MMLVFLREESKTEIETIQQEMEKILSARKQTLSFLERKIIDTLKKINNLKMEKEEEVANAVPEKRRKFHKETFIEEKFLENPNQEDKSELKNSFSFCSIM